MKKDLNIIFQIISIVFKFYSVSLFTTEEYKNWFPWFNIYTCLPQDTYFVIDDLQTAFYADDSSGSHPLLHQAGLFSSVTYSKVYPYLP